MILIKYICLINSLKLNPFVSKDKYVPIIFIFRRKTVNVV